MLEKLKMGVKQLGGDLDLEMTVLIIKYQIEEWEKRRLISCY